MPLLTVRIRHPDEFDAGQISEDARMVTAHDAHADYTYAQWTVRAIFRGLHHGRRNPPAGSRGESFSSMTARGWRWPRIRLWTRFESKSYTYRRPLRNVLNHHFGDRLDQPQKSLNTLPRVPGVFKSGCSAITLSEGRPQSHCTCARVAAYLKCHSPSPLGQLLFARYKTRNDKTLVQDPLPTRLQHQELPCL